MLLLYRQIELARAKAVVKLADITKEYDEATMDVYHEACDASAMTNVELEQEVISLKQQVYVLQQASAKHDNFLQNLGMER